MARFIFASLIYSLAFVASAYPVTEAGNQLSAFLDSLDVSHKWLAGRHVDWMTGEPDHVEGGVTKSHCSAFVASATLQLDAYILRPPQHSELLLANAQSDWLLSQGYLNGWFEIDDGMSAQKVANDGCVVVASYHNPDPNKPGHIAIVRPSDKSDADLQNEGPQITQAGLENYQSASLLQGFIHHIKSAQDTAVIYYGHGTKWCPAA